MPPKIQISETDDQLFITARPEDPLSFEALFQTATKALAAQGAVPVHERIFGHTDTATAAATARTEAYRAAGLDPSLPFAYLDGKPPWGKGVSGLLIHAVKPGAHIGNPTPVFSGERRAGSRLRTDRAEYMFLQGFDTEVDPRASRASQTEQFLNAVDTVIRNEGFSFRDVVRTWFYLKEILDWYDTFNQVRSAAYERFGIMPSGATDLLLPASTGIEGHTPLGSCVAADLLLVRPFDGTPPTRMRNPAQKEAFRYGSAFSRAVEIRERDASLIEISGTAAIDESGKSLYPDDAETQIRCTLDKISVLLSGVDASVHNIVSATVFVKHPEIAPLFEKVLADRGFENFPGIIVHADVCRDDLLFEIDAEAIKPRE